MFSSTRSLYRGDVATAPQPNHPRARRLDLFRDQALVALLNLFANSVDTDDLPRTVAAINETGSPNLAPMSSAFWLGWRCMLGFEAVSKTPNNIVRTGECVLNLPSMDQVGAINRLSRLTGSNPVPAGKALRGYRHHADKFGIAGLTPEASETVDPPRVLECPIQLEAELVRVNPMMTDEYDYAQLERSAECTLEGIVALEVRIKRVHVVPVLLVQGQPNRIDPDRWKPIIMSFCRYYGLASELAVSKLPQIPEEQYRSPDIDRASVELLRKANGDRAAAD